MRTFTRAFWAILLILAIIFLPYGGALLGHWDGMMKDEDMREFILIIWAKGIICLLPFLVGLVVIAGVFYGLVKLTNWVFAKN